MKATLFILLFFGYLLQPVAATGLPPGFDDDDDEGVSQGVERARVDYQRLLLQAMLEEVEKQEVVYLELDNERQFIALAREALSASPKGQVLLLPGDGRHPNWPEGIASLRKQLADYGWNTLALSLPLYQPLGPPARTLPPGPLLLRPGATTEPPGETANQENNGFPGDFNEEEAAPEEAPALDPGERLADHQAAVEERLQVASSYFPNQGRQVLLLQGEAVFWLLPWLEAQAGQQQLTLLLLQVRVPEGARAADLNRFLRSLTNQPLLDIYIASDPEQAQLAEQRQAAYRRSDNRQAVQLNLERAPGASLGKRERWLAQRVEGWLRSLD